ncbi:MAG: hypothetical protein LBC18_11800 [Opitutaceae bacterium]|jgi:hypothetical protein|nr:hypothetical protein [Opitutaceae bacterium]
MLSMRAIFRWMLAGWFAAAGLLAMFLDGGMENRQIGEIIARIFSRPSSAPSAIPVLPHKPENPVPVLSPKPENPAPVVTAAESGWTPMPRGQAPGKGRIGTPRFTFLPDKSLEIRLPYQGHLGGETHFIPRGMKVATPLDALSVDLHGVWEFSQPTDTHIEKSAVCRVQIYPHPGHLRISAISCAQESHVSTLTVQAFFSSEEIRLLFSPSKG